MSVICQTFVQNAWRSDLCSNCFKCLDEHRSSSSDNSNNIDNNHNNRMTTSATHRYMPQATSLYQSRGISSTLKWRLSEPIYERVARRDFGSQTPPKTNNQQTQELQHQHDNSNRGILIKGNAGQEKKLLKSRPTVDFASEEALVIGYGGNDYDSDQSPWEMASDDESIDLDLLDDTDEDRNISRLTRNNTEFNSSNKNLDPVVNNNNNRNNNNSSLTTKQQPLTCVTRNDIGSTQNRYYFSTVEPIKSYLHGGDVDNSKVDNIRKAVDNNLLVVKDDFSPLNTRTYSMLSELTNSKSSGSDSDYSTCRLTTPGDSTDSESFQDAEEGARPPLPCQSFLHGSFPRKSKSISDGDVDKKYDGGSSTSGDVSNLSDDSDAVETGGEQRTFKSRNARSTKATVDASKRVEKSTFDLNDPVKAKSTEVSIDSKRGVEKKSTSFDLNLNDPAKKPTTSKSSIDAKKEVVPNKMSPPDVDLNLYEDVRKLAISKSSEIDAKKGVVLNKKFSTSSPDVDLNPYEPAKVPTTTRSSEIDAKKGIVPDKKYSTSPPDFDLNEPAKRSATSKSSEIDVKKRVIPNKMSPPDFDLNEPLKKPTTSKQSETDIKKGVVPDKKSPSPPSIQKERDSTPSHKGGQSNKEQTPPNPPLETNLQNIIALNETTPKSSDNPHRNVRKPTAPVQGPPKQVSDEDDEGSSSPEAITNRQSKLAALALELELARRDSELKSGLSNHALKCVVPQQHIGAFATIRKNGGTPCLPDVLQDSPKAATPGKLKKNRFSLKKLLKRTKDVPPQKDSNNPKAWKKQTFDRNRLSLEIVHPMDLSPPTSGGSTPTDEGAGYGAVSTHPGRGAAMRGGYSRARSLSALPQLGAEYQEDPSTLDEDRRVDTMPTRKAGTVAERKKNRPALVRTPSCSALPNRPSAQDRTPPPKPPPPPKCMQPPPPPPPPHQHRKPPTCSPARPPPPKIPETKSRIPSGDSSRTDQRDSYNLDKEYANLGDIRSLMTPKKPQRPSAVSVCRDSSDGSKPHNNAAPPPPQQTPHNTTTTHAQEEEDHYTYLDDDAEVKSSKRPLVPATVAPPKEYISPKRIAPVSGRPWLDLQTSYAAIAAANYESLAEIITTSMSEGAELFQDGGKSLRWRDFTIHDGDSPQQVAGDRTLYTATHNHKGNKVLLMVSPKHQSGPQNPRHQVRFPVLATFTDSAPPLHPTPSSVYALHHPATVFPLSHFTTRSERPSHLHLRDTCFVLLQLIHALKGLQAEGTEDLDWDPDRLLLMQGTPTEGAPPPSLVLFPEDKARATLSVDSSTRKKTLCQAISASLFQFLGIRGEPDLGSCSVRGEPLPEPVAHTFRVISRVLGEEKAQSLSQAKGLLEYMLWGPVDLGAASENEEGAVQRWLDLQRAQVLKSAVATATRRLGVYEEYQLVFLLQASVKSLKSVISKLCE